MFTKAIVRTPAESIVKGLTSANLGKPDYGVALYQHQLYVDALKTCGLKVIELKAEEKHPDSTFIEDVALLTPKVAIITNPGAPSRRGEIGGMEEILQDYFVYIEHIKAPGTVEAGDIMMAGGHYYIGISRRTNEPGAKQVINILEKYGMSGSMIKLEKMLHLKTGASYLEDNNLVATGELLTRPEFQKFNILKVDPAESYATNCVRVNNHVLVAKGFPKTRNLIEKAGYHTLEVDVSEFRKMDGGLSCLSLRF